jgi:hypothetical protein
VESDWFRRGRHSADRPNGNGAGNGAGTGTSNGTNNAVPESTTSWASASDEGWRAAEAVSKPASGGVTMSGLPKRIPKANLVPGAAGGSAPAAPAAPPVRSAAITRDRFASFQRGIRDARAAVNSQDDDGGEGDGGT